MTVTLSVTKGTLTLSGTTGLSFNAGANGSASMTVTGSISSLNGALNNLVFTPAVNAVGSATLTITTTDNESLTDTDTVAITINAVNDAPVNTIPGAQTTPEDTVKTFSAAGGNAITVADVDDNDDGSAGDEQVQVTLDATAGTLTLPS